MVVKGVCLKMSFFEKGGELRKLEQHYNTLSDDIMVTMTIDILMMAIS